MAGADDLFRAIDPHRWELSGGNPVLFLQEVPAQSLMSAAANQELVAASARAAAAIRAEIEAAPHPGVPPDRPVAFFCAEYGIHRTLPVYSGGLGVLAGDVVKAASDLGLPFVAVGLMYRKGYFHQRLDLSGWQHEFWIDTEPERLPVSLVTNGGGDPLTVTAPLGDHGVTLRIWRVDVGRVPLFLLDAECPENSRADRWITARLYVGRADVRLQQYVLLGIGGVRALQALGYDPSVVHLNEGHAALAPLEMARAQVERGFAFDDAIRSARSRTIFTTHTPVPAGNESFDAGYVLQLLQGFPQSLGTDAGGMLALGRVDPQDSDEPFGMTVLGIRMSRARNGVSRIHGEVSRGIWQHLFPGTEVSDVPIGHITNGVHAPTWIAPQLRSLLDRYLPENWLADSADPAVWECVGEIPDKELWQARTAMRADLVAWVRDRSIVERLARGEGGDYVGAAAQTFDPEVLTLGFARRVATYKRLHLLAHDPERAFNLLGGPRRIQIVLAGKAHPSDDEAKAVVQKLFALKGGPNIAERVVFLEDYDLASGAQLTRGCDVWVNLPRPPMEASGTSGMKSAVNGGLNLSVLDGWWAEAYDGENGWAIEAVSGADPAEQDARDANRYFELLENEILPLFYERDADGVPTGWVGRIKQSLRTNGPRFSAQRMMLDYVREMYGVETAR